MSLPIMTHGDAATPVAAGVLSHAMIRPRAPRPGIRR
jgi:hypothetical protein